MAIGIKKWFMLQMWRVQQISQILTLAMMAVTLSLTLYEYVRWREDSIFSQTYVGVGVIILALASVIWVAAYIWDIRMKMWREQMTVLVERNPYAKEKMSSKEVVNLGLTWLPLLEKFGKDDPKIAESAEALRKWIQMNSARDPLLAKDVKEVFEMAGNKEANPLKK
jgi:hypothetical protein